jgi:hypothetical protein
LLAANIDQEDWQDAKYSIFRVRHYEGKFENKRYIKQATNYGTAFSLALSHFGFSDKQYLITAAHTVVKNGEVLDKLEVRIPDGKDQYDWYPIKVRAYDLTNDIALVKLEKKYTDMKELPLGKEPEDRAVLLTAGFPGVDALHTSVGHLITKELLAPNDNPAHWEASLDVKHGSSGGPDFC